MLKKLRILIFPLSLSVLLVQCERNPVSAKMRPLTSLEKRLVQSGNEFGFRLFREINKGTPGQNVFISPLSVSMALGMTLNGANGSTLEAMQQTLALAGLNNDDINQSYRSLIDLLTTLDTKVLFDIANSIWYKQEYTFEPQFMDLNRTYFDAEVQALDFSDPKSVDTINRWVDEKTRGKIQKILDRIDSRDVMFLINAIYFKGTWTYEFDKKHTEDDLFNLPDGSQKPIKMMAQTGSFPYFQTDDFQAVDLPYGDRAFSMTIILPRPNRDLDSLIAALTPESWDQWMQSFAPATVTVQLPKFKMKYDTTLNEVLKALGMGIAFDPMKADFTRMYSPGGIFISFVRHKTFVQVDEEGTEAAAVTAVGVRATSVGDSGPILVRVDRPFLFAIRERQSGTLLFVGKIVEPSFE